MTLLCSGGLLWAGPWGPRSWGGARADAMRICHQIHHRREEVDSDCCAADA